MKTIILSVLAGAIFGALVATAGQALSQQPSWYRDTIVGQWEQRRQIEDLQFQEELRRSYSSPSQLPCE